MKTKIDILDFITLIEWVKISTEYEGREFNFQNLYDQAQTYKLTNTPLDTNIHNIDDFMVEALKKYINIKTIKKQFEDLINNLKLPFDIKPNNILEHVEKYQLICEDLMLNYKYEHTEICGIQLGFLNEKMEKYVYTEEYEKAALCLNMINSIKNKIKC